MYRKRIILMALCMAITSHVMADDSVSHTFFFVPPHFTPVMENTFFREDRMNMTNRFWSGAMQIVPYVSHSTKPHELAKFFMPFHRWCLNVSEYKQNVATTDLNPKKIVEARHFNIETDQSASTTFNSTISFAPEQHVTGVALALKQIVWRNKQDNPALWVEL